VVPAGSQGTHFVPHERALYPGEALERAREAYHRPIELWRDKTWADE